MTFGAMNVCIIVLVLLGTTITGAPPRQQLSSRIATSRSIAQSKAKSSSKSKKYTSTATVEDAVQVKVTSNNWFDVKVKQSLDRLYNGVRRFPKYFMEVSKLEKLKKTKGSEALTFTEHKLMETWHDDKWKLVKMLVTLPFSPEFFLYTYLVFPAIGNGQPWAWAQLPSVFDTSVDEMNRREVIQNRRLHAVVSSIITLKSQTIDPGDDHKKATRERQLNIIERALRFANMKEAIQACAPLLLSENDKKPVPMKMKLRNVPGKVVKDCIGAMGLVGYPNVPLVNYFNRQTLSDRLDKLRDSDDFIAAIGVPSLSSSELVVACRERCIRTTNRNDNALREELTQWLDIALDPIPFSRKSKTVINDQHRRIALLGLHTAKDFKQSDFSSIFKAVAT